MAEPERIALEHIRQVVESVLGRSSSKEEHTISESEFTAPDMESVPEPDLSLLNVPFLSCASEELDDPESQSGKVCAAMLIHAYTDKKPSLERFLVRTTQKNGQIPTVEKILTGMKYYGVLGEQRINLNMSDLAVVLSSGRPLILKVMYDGLRSLDKVTGSSKHSQYVVCVGLDVNNICVHDPLKDLESGKDIKIPYHHLYRIWSETDPFRSAIIPRQALLRRVRVITPEASLYARPGDNSGEYSSIVKEGEVFEISQEIDQWGKVGQDQWIDMNCVQDIT
jgi:hypothetical protein